MAQLGHHNQVLCEEISPDGKYVLTGSGDGAAILWEAATGKELRVLGGHRGNVESLALFTRWEVHIDRKRGPERVPGQALHRKHGFDSLVGDCYRKAPGGVSRRLVITVNNLGGGIGAVQVLVNGKEVAADARGKHPTSEAASAKLFVDLSGAPLQPGKLNDITIVSRNRDGSWAPVVNAARGPTVMTRQTAPVSAAPELYVVVAGINTYSGGEVRPLTFPDQDARQIAKALNLGADRLLGSGHFHLSMLSDQSAKDAELPAGALLLTPTRRHFEQVFGELAKKVRPTDILVVYFSGHGTAFVDPASKDAVKDTYCYLTQEANSFDVRDDKVRATCAITSKELATWTDAHHIQALKQVLILDTCYAGSAKNDLVVRRADAAEHEIATRALSDTKDLTRFFVLMGCAKDAVSYEASQFGQGLLTYALLRGLQGDQLKNGEFVDVAPWFEYAAHLVPELARETGNVQAPQMMQRTDVSGSSLSNQLQTSSFSIGQLTAADKVEIHLPQPHPLVMRPNFLDETGEDDLKLSAEVRRLLLAGSFESPKGRQSGLVYVDANPEDNPGAIVVGGVYRRAGQNWTVNLVIRKGDQRLQQTITVGQDALASKVLAAIQTAAAGLK